MKKKRETAGEVDTSGKELGKCTHQWTTNDEKKNKNKKNERFRHLVSSSEKKKEDRQQQKEERSREEDRREGGNQTGSKEFQQRIDHVYGANFSHRTIADGLRDSELEKSGFKMVTVWIIQFQSGTKKPTLM